MQISIWEQESFFAQRDIIIIGAGLSGLWCAYELIQREPKIKILILDKGIIPAGASTRNAGFACFGSPTELLYDAATMGADRMWQIAAMRYKGIEKMKQVFGTDMIDYDNCGGFECLQKDKHDLAGIKEQLHWLNAGLETITGTKQTFAWANDKLQTFGLSGFDALIENTLEGTLHSGKLVQALTKKVQALGVDILTGICINNFDETGQGVTVNTDKKIRFLASQLIICSNAFTNALLPALNITPARGQILVTTPITGLKLRGSFHFEEGFYYFRNIGDRLLLGGARNKSFVAETSDVFDTTDIIQQELLRFINTHILPEQSFDVDYCWSGIMGFTEDKQPLVKKISERITAVVACNGMGVALSPVIAETIRL